MHRMPGPDSVDSELDAWRWRKWAALLRPLELNQIDVSALVWASPAQLMCGMSLGYRSVLREFGDVGAGHAIATHAMNASHCTACQQQHEHGHFDTSVCLTELMRPEQCHPSAGTSHDMATVHHGS